VRVATDESEEVLNLAPMIDVVFLLLIFFMVSTTFIEKEKELGIELPQAEAGEPSQHPDELVINLLEDGTIKMNGEVLDPEDGLRAALERFARATPDIPVTVRGDRDVTWQRGIDVVSTCQVLGLRNVGLATLDR
jgi:biopolymer transport protein ExbD